MKFLIITLALLLPITTWCIICKDGTNDCNIVRIGNYKGLTNLKRTDENFGSSHTLVIKVTSETSSSDVMEVAQRNGFLYKGTVGILTNYHILERSISERAKQHQLNIEKSVISIHEQKLLQRVKRATTISPPHGTRPPVLIKNRNNNNNVKRTTGANQQPFHYPTDPLFDEQWHLTDMGETYYLGYYNLSVEEAWRKGITGYGITIGITDDGFAIDHADLKDNYRSETSWDFNREQPSPTPDFDTVKRLKNYHGTCVAGLAAAGANSACGVGVAYHAKFSGIRVVGEATSYYKEAMALSFRCTPPGYTNDWSATNDIMSASWGPYDDGLRLEGPDEITMNAIETCIEQGRRGLGTIYTWAGGNGKMDLDNSNYDGFANSPYTIAVGALAPSGESPYYSEPGSNILVVAPSSSDHEVDTITTTDIQGFSGYSEGDCFRGFTGTSASAPMVAGVTALILEANPNLGWRDVQHIYAMTSRRISSGHSSWIRNGAGRFHSDYFGFGLVDAGKAIHLAQQWTNVPTRQTWRFPLDVDGHHVAFHSTEQLNIDVGTIRDNIDHKVFVEHVQLRVVLEAPHKVSHVNIKLCSPYQTCSILLAYNQIPYNDIDWTFMTLKNWGEDMIDESSGNSRWSIYVTNTKDRISNPIVINELELIIHGHIKTT